MPVTQIWPFLTSGNTVGSITSAASRRAGSCFWGSFVIVGTLGISLYQLRQIHKQPAHKSMLDVAEIIFQTCKTYLIQQGKFLLMLFAIIAVAMAFYFSAWNYKRDDTDRATTRARSSTCSSSSPSSAWAAPTRWPGTASASTPTPTARTAFASLARRAVGRRQHPAAGRHVDRPVPDLARTGHDGHHPAVRADARSSATASSASPSANRSAPRRCASPAASSPRSPTSAPT